MYLVVPDSRNFEAPAALASQENGLEEFQNKAWTCTDWVDGATYGYMERMVKRYFWYLPIKHARHPSEQSDLRRQFAQQQWHLIRQAGDTKLHPRKQFIKDLGKFLSPHHRSGTDILLMGDFNETLGDSIRGLDLIVKKYNLLD